MRSETSLVRFIAIIATVAGQLVTSNLLAAEEPNAAVVKAPLGLPPLPDYLANSSPGKIELGRRLFFERRLSFNNTLSCGMCHLEEDAFASTQSKLAIGMEGRTLRRNAPTVLNVAYQKTLFHDGREPHLLIQAWMPLLDHDEMANPSMGYALDRVAQLDDYKDVFEKVYPGEGVSVRTVGDAIAAYEATLLSGNSRFDKWHFGSDKNALTESEKSGFAIFTGKGKCSTCHEIGESSALFTDHKFHNTGIGYRAVMLGDEILTVPLAPGVEVKINRSEVNSFSEKLRNDIGRFAISQKPEDRWAYKTAMLRSVSRTFPYMHDGSIPTLEAVVDYYNQGGVPNEALSPKIRPLGLTDTEKQDLVAFLKSLDGDEAQKR